jgi:hypothetical protein
MAALTSAASVVEEIGFHHRLLHVRKGLGGNHRHGVALVLGRAPIEFQGRGALALEIEHRDGIPAGLLDHEPAGIREAVLVHIGIFQDFLAADHYPYAVIRLGHESVTPGLLQMDHAFDQGAHPVAALAGQDLARAHIGIERHDRLANLAFAFRDFSLEPSDRTVVVVVVLDR